MPRCDPVDLRVDGNADALIEQAGRFTSPPRFRSPPRFTGPRLPRRGGRTHSRPRSRGSAGPCEHAPASSPMPTTPVPRGTGQGGRARLRPRRDVCRVCLADRCDPEKTRHTLADMVGIACSHPGRQRCRRRPGPTNPFTGCCSRRRVRHAHHAAVPRLETAVPAGRRNDRAHDLRRPVDLGRRQRLQAAPGPGRPPRSRGPPRATRCASCRSPYNGRGGAFGPKRRKPAILAASRSNPGKHS